VRRLRIGALGPPDASLIRGVGCSGKVRRAASFCGRLRRRGDVRRAKLYYLRDRSGKSARIREKLDLGATEAAPE